MATEPACVNFYDVSVICVPNGYAFWVSISSHFTMSVAVVRGIV